MGSFTKHLGPGVLQDKAKAKRRREDAQAAEADQLRGEQDDEFQKKKAAAAKGRTALIQTTPQGVLSPQNSGRKRLTV